jgi:hypothetical protein
MTPVSPASPVWAIGWPVWMGAGAAVGRHFSILKSHWADRGHWFHFQRCSTPEMELQTRAISFNSKITLFRYLWPLEDANPRTFPSDHLPDEIILHILQFISTQGLCHSVIKVNKRLANIIGCDSSLSIKADIHWRDVTAVLLEDWLHDNAKTLGGIHQI